MIQGIIFLYSSLFKFISLKKDLIQLSGDPTAPISREVVKSTGAFPLRGIQAGEIYQRDIIENP
jgi:hypothetical protein